MRDYPKGGLIGKTVHGIRAYFGLRISLFAANACFFLILSIFPMLLVLLGLLQFTPLEVERLGEMLPGLLPEGLLEPTEELILTTYDKAGSFRALGLSAVTALWSSGRGIHSLMTGLNAVYGVPETRSYLHTRSLCVLYTLALAAVLILTLALHIFGATLLVLLQGASHPLLVLLGRILSVRFFILLAAQTIVFTGMYMVLPCGGNRLLESLPGALLASLGWLVYSNLYSIYVARFATLSNIFGSVYGIALYLLWLYFCMVIFLTGGVLNRMLAGKK